MNLAAGKLLSEYDLDDPRRTLQHRDIILSKPFLKKIYTDWYIEIFNELKGIPNGKKLEIGSGGGFIKELVPEFITSDILELPNVDMAFSAEEMPFADDELSAISMINVLHHIPDVRNFFSEASRTLKPGGKVVMIEPANSPMSRFIYKRFHHELFDEKRDWSFPATGPLSGSNQALPYIVFKRDRPDFERSFPELKIQTVRLHTGFRYIVSGGVSRKQLLPDFTFAFIKKLEAILPGLTGMFQTIVLKKNEQE
ncbi:MAG: class I SAM-dependent methyltransferase [Vicingaceae bacterium]